MTFSIIFMAVMAFFLWHFHKDHCETNGGTWSPYLVMILFFAALMVLFFAVAMGVTE
jgi:hypothetical protein